MGVARVRYGLAFVLLVAGCSGGGVTTTEALRATTEAPTTSSVASTTSTSQPPETTAAPLVTAGCGAFDAAELTALSPIDNELALLENSSNAEELVCNFVGVADGLDTGIRIEVARVEDKPDGHFDTPGEVESAIELVGRPGVGSGRNLVRILLDDDTGVTVTVTIRSLSSSATIPRDGQYLDIRDAVAVYIIGQLT